MRLDKTYNRIAGELLAQERLRHRKPDGTTDHEGAARAAFERIAADYPQFDDYQRSECPVYILTGRSKSLESSAKGTATAKGNGSTGLPKEKRSRDTRMFIWIEGKGYVYATEVSIAQAWAEIDRRRGHIEAEEAGVSDLVWLVEVAGSLGADENDLIGDYIVFE